MAITISGENNNDKILASDGVIDQISGINFTGITTANHINVGSNIQLGNAGIITATTFIGNLTGNINSASNLLFQISGSEKFRVGNGGQFGIAGANYGSSGQVFTSGGSGSAPSWTTPVVTGFTNGSNNRVVTSTGGAGLNGEANLTFNGSILNLTGDQAVSSGNRIYFGNSDVAWVKGVHGASGYLELGVNTAHVTINRTGHIGIGTDNPTLSLQGNWSKVLALSAGTSTGSMIRFIESSSAAGGSNTGLLVGQHNNNSYIVNYQSGFMDFRTGGAQRMSITSGGSVNIGGDYTQTSRKLKVTGDSTFAGDILFGSIQGGGFSVSSGNVIMPAKIAHDGDSDTNFGFPTTDTFQVETAGTERLRINSSGQVLIGTNSSPDCKLHITNGTLKIETHTTFYSGSGENGENYPSIFLNADHSSGNNPAHGKITVRHSNQNTYSGDLVFMPQGYYSGSYGYQEVMRVSAYKRVGINVTPSSTLHVVNTTSESTIAQFGQSSGARYARFNNIPGQQNFDHLLLSRYDNNLGYQLRLQNTDASNTGYGSAIQFVGHGGSQTGLISVINRIANSSTARMHFNVSGVSIMHLEHAPNRVMIGEPPSGGGFLPNCTYTPLQCRPSSGNTGCFAGSSKTYATNFGLLPWAGGGTYLSSGITYNNGAWIHQSDNNDNCLLYMRGGGWYWYSSNNGSGSWNVASGTQIMNNVGQWTGGTSSDRRLKDNITNMNTSDALTKVTQLQGVSYTWNDAIQKKYGTSSYPEGTHYGFIAQDVKTVWPEAHIISDIDNESDFDADPTKDVKDDVYYGDIEGVKMEKMVPLLVEAIKELKKENDALKARVTSLEGS